MSVIHTDSLYGHALIVISKVAVSDVDIVGIETPEGCNSFGCFFYLFYHNSRRGRLRELIKSGLGAERYIEFRIAQVKCSQVDDLVSHVEFITLNI